MLVGTPQPELVEDVPDMPLDGLAAEREALGDPGVGHALCHEGEYALFSVAQPPSRPERCWRVISRRTMVGSTTDSPSATRCSASTKTWMFETRSLRR